MGLNETLLEALENLAEVLLEIAGEQREIRQVIADLTDRIERLEKDRANLKE